MIFRRRPSPPARYAGFAIAALVSGGSLTRSPCRTRRAEAPVRLFARLGDMTFGGIAVLAGVSAWVMWRGM